MYCLFLNSLRTINKNEYIFFAVGMVLAGFAVLEFFFFADKTKYLITALASFINIPFIYGYIADIKRKIMNYRTKALKTKMRKNIN